MNKWHQHCFFEQAAELRDLDRETAELILEAEGIDIVTASMEDCKKAVVKWQYIPDGKSLEWLVRREQLAIKVAEIRRVR